MDLEQELSAWAQERNYRTERITSGEHSFYVVVLPETTEMTRACFLYPDSDSFAAVLIAEGEKAIALGGREHRPLYVEQWEDQPLSAFPELLSTASDKLMSLSYQDLVDHTIRAYHEMQNNPALLRVKRMLEGKE